MLRDMNVNSILYLSTAMVLHICAYLVLEWSQQPCEVMELSGVEEEIVFKLVGANGGILLAQTMQLKVWHHFHVLLDQSSLCVKVSWLLRRSGEKNGVKIGETPQKSYKRGTLMWRMNEEWIDYSYWKYSVPQKKSKHEQMHKIKTDIHCAPFKVISSQFS